MTEDLEAILKKSGDIPILGQQQIPVMSGININGNVMTIHELVQLDEEQFRELMLAVIINMMGGVYAPPPEQEDLPENGMHVPASAGATASAEVIKAGDKVEHTEGEDADGV